MHLGDLVRAKRNAAHSIIQAPTHSYRDKSSCIGRLPRHNQQAITTIIELGNTIMLQSPYFASIDLGSNSFHMIIGKLSDGQLEIVDREKEMVQLARGLNTQGELEQDAKTRALACLARFSERLRDIPASHVRAIGTKALRSAHDSRSFIRLAEQQLGHAIQIVSGYEEARLVYCGLAHSLSSDPSARLVIDIGGGSTEYIIGKNDNALMLESLSMGCVTYTKRFFDNSQHFADSMHKAYVTACSEIESFRRRYCRHGWRSTYGTSGTIKAIGQLINANGASVIERDDLHALVKTIIQNEGLDKKCGLPKLRIEVLPAGIAILKAIFDQLRIKQLHISDVTLKEGLIYDTAGRFSKEDSRETTVSTMMQRYDVEVEQAERVEALSLTFWEAIKASNPKLLGISRTKTLRWASRLHEIGLNISHSAYHQHSHYLLKHSDLAGFGRLEQHVLASLVRSHRKRIRMEHIDNIDDSSLDAFIPLLICLRLAVLFNRRREPFELNVALTQDTLSDSQRHYTVTLDNDWLRNNPLTHDGLIREAEYLANIDVELDLVQRTVAPILATES